MPEHNSTPAWKGFIYFGLVPGSPDRKMLEVEQHNVNIPS